MGSLLYLSEFLESRRDQYYAGLQNISRSGDWTSWIEFFLEAVTPQALENTVRVRNILALYDAMKNRIQTLTRSQHTIKILDTLFDRPIFQSSDFVERTGIPKQTALPILRKLKDAGILRPLREKSGRRSAILAFPELLNRAEGRQVI